MVLFDISQKNLKKYRKCLKKVTFNTKNGINMTKSYIYRPKAQQIITTRYDTMNYRKVIDYTIITI